MTVSSSQSVIYELTTFTLTCSIELFEEISNFMILNVTWKGPAGATLTDTLSVSETSYTSTSTADTPGNYSCSARLVSNSEHLLSSSETINTISIVTGEFDNYLLSLVIFFQNILFIVALYSAEKVFMHAVIIERLLWLKNSYLTCKPIFK